MNQVIEISVLPHELDQADIIRSKVYSAMQLSLDASLFYRLLKRSLDARKAPVYRYRIEVSSKPFDDVSPWAKRYKNVNNASRVIIIGAGPAGYFAALECIELGLKPIVLERGKNAQDRRRDLRAIQQFHQVHPHSNYCYGEGGAGTYSDGKLYTRSGKRGDIHKVLELLVEHGAIQDILIDAHPHIGSNRLPEIIQRIRERIIEFGGEVHFDQFVTELHIENEVFLGATTAKGDKFMGSACILATGHSARDIFYLLAQKNLTIECKPFAVGVRIEHPQSMVDQVQYHASQRDPHLPPASYSLACSIDNRGVFSFCMCPGGLMVPSATAPGEIVINGMSLSRRDSKYANSGTVVSVQPQDFKDPSNPLCGVQFQQELEQSIFRAGDGSQRAPAQRLTDFISGKLSTTIQESSYIPGHWSAPLHELLPSFIVQSLKEGIKIFGKKMKGYLTEDALVVAPESRTSSPIRIPRNSLSMHPQCQGLFPCGEGAGYAGGIMSAALDGQLCARASFQYILTKNLKL